MTYMRRQFITTDNSSMQQRIAVSNKERDHERDTKDVTYVRRK